MPPSEIVVVGGRLYHLGVRPGQVAPNLLQVGDPARAYRVAARFDSVSHEVREREFVTLTGSRRGVPLTVLGTGIGTDNVEIALVEAYVALAFDLETACRKSAAPAVNLIRIGTSGGIQADLEPGTLAISEYALGLDSTGLYYDQEAADRRARNIEREAGRLLEEAAEGRFKGRLPVYASRSSAAVHRALVEQAGAAGANFRSGITASTPGFYGPSGRLLEGVRNSVPDLKRVLSRLEVDGRKVINVEMESSLLFHLAAALGCRAGTICPVVSHPESHGSLADYRPQVEQSIDIALAVMERLAASDGD